MRAMHEIREILNPTPLEVVSLMDWERYPPHAEYEKLLPYFDHTLWIQNMYKYAVARREYRQMTGIEFPLMVRMLESESFYNSFFKNHRKIPNVRQSLGSVFNETGSTPDLSGDRRDIVEELKRKIDTGTSNPVLCISGNHATTYYSTRAALELGNNGRNGLLVFDQHIDTEGEQHLFAPDIEKANVFAQMARLPLYSRERQIRALGFIGPTRKQYHRFVGHEEPYLNRTGTDFIVYPEDEYTEHGIVNRQKLKEFVDLSIYRFKASAVNSFGISVDMDVLNAVTEKLSAIEYSLLPAHVNLGVQNLKRTWDLRKYSQGDPAYYDGFVKRLLQAAVSILEPKKDLENLDWQNYYSGTLGYGTGMSVDDLCFAIQHAATTARLHGIQFGLTISQSGKKYLGDIVELAGYDYRNKTALAALKIAEAMKRAAVV